jgi:hypothetical protein
LPLFTAPLPAGPEDVSPAAAILPRDSFALDLPQLTIQHDNETGEFSGVSVAFPESADRAIIGLGEDYAIKTTAHGLEKTLYRKLPGREDRFSAFDANIIGRVDTRFCAALDSLDNLLKEKDWNRCRYFDSYFPHFLSGWYYMLSSARNSLYALPRACRAPEKEFDVSLSSPKTDARVAAWASLPDSAGPLRKACRALHNQLSVFQKSLETIKDREDTPVPAGLTDALSQFIGIYFTHR